jgi:SAM-dependent methyltransferase
MKLWQLRRHWDALARKDPYFAVLTEDDKAGGRWDPRQFFATGVEEVRRDLEQIEARVPGFPRRRALDFGCGAGRLSQALAASFEQVTGVDISGEMIALARRHCERSNVAFVHNTRSDLRDFPMGSFTLVYSRITLQHIAPAYTLRYLREFSRVLALGGVLSVQIPEKVPAGEPPDRLKFSFWPPTLWMRIKRNIRYHHPGWFPDTPKMQMYAVPREEVVRCLEECGLAVVAVDATAHDAVSNLTYLAVRRA